ncbi:MAG: glycosyl hydrolase family 28-related protein [Armatimonadota bacterium]
MKLLPLYITGLGIAFLLMTQTAYAVTGTSPSKAQLPILNWEPRSDWLNVKTSGAIGNGITDDTDAIQKTLDQVKDGSTVYLPEGTYRITKMLTLRGPLHGILVVGHGRNTTIIWDGEIGGKLFMDDGIAYSRFVGITFKGQNKASIGFWHYSDRRFETEVRHQHLAFFDFTEAGIKADPNDQYALAETTFENCLFVRCKCAVSFVQFNDYDFTFDGCEFQQSDTAIDCVHGNFYIRDCRFEGSKVVDIHAFPEHGSSVRRCTSVGSNAFIAFDQPVGTMTIQDCHVSAWKNPDGAILLGGAPVIIFDCVFTNPPSKNPPVKINKVDQKLIISQNISKASGKVFYPDSAGEFYTVPGGTHKGSISSFTQRFLTDNINIPGKVFDAKRDFGAKGDSITDDTSAIQKTIDAARNFGKGSIAYLPTGTYVVKKTLSITGKDYYVGGSGWYCRLLWKGAEGGTTIEVHNPLNVALENINVGSHDVGDSNNGIDINQIGSDKPSRMTYDGVWGFGMYQRQPFRKGFRFNNLGKNSVVVMPHVNANMHFLDCAQATILANCSYEGSIVVEGKDTRRSGLIGIQTRLATLVTHALYLRDNQNFVASDFYIEQADNGYKIEGSSTLPAGRVTIQGAKIHLNNAGNASTAMEINNYHGKIFLGHNQFYIEPKETRIRHTGDSTIDLYVTACSFYDSKPDIRKGDAANIYFIGNQSFGMQTVQYDAKDLLPRTGLSDLVYMMDDLRRLGETDLKLNHQQVMK